MDRKANRKNAISLNSIRRADFCRICKLKTFPKACKTRRGKWKAIISEKPKRISNF